MGNNPPGAGTPGEGKVTPNPKGLGIIGKSFNDKITSG
jgi:hypothetical protein